MDPDATKRFVPGDFLVHPVSLAAIAILLLNDHVLKRQAPSWITGKLSDVAGMVLLPLVLVALVELLRRNKPATVQAFCIAAAITAAGFAAVKLVPAVADAYQSSLSWLRYGLTSLAQLVVAGEVAPRGNVSVADDPSDAAVIPFTLAAVWVGARTRRCSADATRAKRSARPS